MHPVCPICNTKWIKFGSKVKFTKMRTKPFFVHFFKDSLNIRAQTLILELNEAKVYTLVNSNIGGVVLKMNEALKKRTGFLVHSLESKTTF